LVDYGITRHLGRREFAMSATKTAIVVLSDPRAGEEALGRLFNALAAAYDFKQRHQDVQLIFQGTGTRWTGLLTKSDHPAHALYKAVQDTVAGVSAGCATIFGAREDAERNGFSMITNNPVPGTPGLPSLASYVADGYSILTF
jgi:DsrE/DsrF/DsrH-like protein